MIQPLGTVAEVLAKSLVVLLSLSHVAKRAILLAVSNHLINSMARIEFYVNIAYYCLAGVFCLVCFSLLFGAVKTTAQQ